MKRLQVLLVDDDAKFCRLIASYLNKHGYDVLLAHDSESAMRLINSRSLNGIIIDVMLPGLNGYELLKKIRESSNIPVLMLTALGGEETDRIVGLEMGADDYLPKSFSAREILARLRAVLRRNERTQSYTKEIKIGELRINISSRKALLANEELALTPVEFDLLLCLAQAKGILMSREQLLNSLGDRNLDSCERSIDVHISSIRKKLHDDPKRPAYIRTVRAAGYMLSDPGEASECD